MADWSWHTILDGKLFTDKTAAETTGFSPRTIESWRLTEDLPYLKVGRQVRIRGEDLADFLDARTERAPRD